MAQYGRLRHALVGTAAAMLMLAGCAQIQAFVDDEPPEEVAEAHIARQGFPDPDACIPVGESFMVQNDAAYQVFGQLDYMDPNTGQPVSQHFFIGTAWAVGDRVLATNAHVAEAFVDSARQGTQITRAIAVQSGTGEVIRLLRALIHPDYTGDPFGSPDVALFTSQELLPVTLELAPADSVLDLGDEFQLTGFPGDVDDAIKVTPGETIPQATSLSGAVTARRSHDPTQEVKVDTLDYYQHQAPTTPGTSGSAIVHCGLVAAINNAGTVNLIVTPDAQGEFVIDRQAAASNNFGVHVRHIHEILDLFEAHAIQGFELPVPAEVQTAPGDAGPVIVGIPDGSGGDGGDVGGDDDWFTVDTLYFEGTAETHPPHSFYIGVDVETGEVFGESDWNGNIYILTGWVDGETGEFAFWDNGPEVDPEYLIGFYFGYLEDNGDFGGYYAEDEVTMYEISGYLSM